jgi:hypothetical protein
MKILKIHSQRLRNEAHYKFMLLVQRLFTDYPAVANIVAPLLVRFGEYLQLEGQLVDMIKSSPLTEKIVEADRRVDRDITGITEAVNSALHHFNPAFVEAAHVIDIRLKAFNGDIEKKAYEEESAAVGILIKDLATVYRPQVVTLGLEKWLDELTNAHNEFDELYILRNREMAERPQQKLADVRKEIDNVYRQIVAQIEAYSVINGDAGVRPFVVELNREVEYFNEHNHHHAKKDIAKADVNSIPDQLYNGEPVIVLPEVFYEGQKLVFAKDYDLTFTKNNAPGTATVAIHGKGAYKGIKNISFNIIRTNS